MYHQHTVLDPQGQRSAGYEKSWPRNGRRCQWEDNSQMDGSNSPESRKLNKLCDGLLSNPVMGDFRCELRKGEIFRYLDQSGKWGLVVLTPKVRPSGCKKDNGDFEATEAITPFQCNSIVFFTYICNWIKNYRAHAEETGMKSQSTNGIYESSNSGAESGTCGSTYVS